MTYQEMLKKAIEHERKAYEDVQIWSDWRGESGHETYKRKLAEWGTIVDAYAEIFGDEFLEYIGLA